MAINPKNRFASATTLQELEDQFEVATSPECLYADGERPRSQAQALYRALNRDYQHRESEIRLEELNRVRDEAIEARRAVKK